MKPISHPMRQALALLPAALALLPVTAFSQVAPVPEEALKPTVPPTSIERTENNPAKAAIAAKEALKKDKAAAASETRPAENLAPEVQRAVSNVEAALGKDKRTASLAIQVRADPDGLIGLHGNVPSLQSRTAAESVAAVAAGKRQVHNYLVVAAGE